jgi:hypothetical protein
LCCVVGIGAAVADHMKHDVVHQHGHLVQLVDHLLEIERRNIHVSIRRRMNTAIAQLVPSFNVGRIGPTMVREPIHAVDGTHGCQSANETFSPAAERLETLPAGDAFIKTNIVGAFSILKAEVGERH